MKNPICFQMAGGRLLVKHGRRLVQEISVHEPKAKPILKWPGGKQWLAGVSAELVPEEYGTFCEPFVGGASFFLALGPGKAILADRNQELISTYQALSLDHLSVIDLLESYEYDESFYYRLRKSRPRSIAGIAARMIYLNRTCWNGLYRVNCRNEFNTPFGAYTNPTICDDERIEQASLALQKAKLIYGDFEKTLKQVKRGDFVFCDPPYVTGHNNNGFLKYNSQLFDWADQERLAKMLLGLSEAGVKIMVSNADHQPVIKLYSGFFYYRIARSSLIAGTPSSRGATSEALIANYPLLGLESEVI